MLKKTGKYKGKSNKLGGGGRFAQIEDALMKKGKSKKAASAIAASIGMKQYGKAKMMMWAHAGMKRKKK